jgi:hypothetical protein
MIISEKQFLQLIELVKLYSREIKLKDPELAKPIDEFIDIIINQQSEGVMIAIKTWLEFAIKN